MRKDFERVAELKEQMRSMLDKAEVEKRSLDEKEKETFAALKTEKELLEMKLERRNLDRSNPAFVSVNRPALFANVVDAIVNRRSLDEYGDAVNENGIKVEQRAEVITDASAVANLTPVVIGEIIEPLEKGLVIDKLGIKMQSGCVGELTFPTLAAIEASIMGENVTWMQGHSLASVWPLLIQNWILARLQQRRNVSLFLCLYLAALLLNPI